MSFLPLPVKQVAPKENPSQAYHSVLAKLQALKRKSPAELFAQRCVYAQFSSQSVCTKTVAAEQFGLLWFTSVSQLSSLLRKKPSSRAICPEICLLQNCLHEKKKTLAELFVLGWIVYSVRVELFAKKEPPGLFALRWVYNSAPVKLFALKEKSGSLAVCTDMIWVNNLSKSSCLHRKKEPAELLKPRWVHYTALDVLFALKGKSASLAVCTQMSLLTLYQPSCLHKKKAPSKLFMHYAEMSLLQCACRAVCTERIKHQPSCFRCEEFTTVYQLQGRSCRA